MTSRTQNNSLTIGKKLQALSLIEHGIAAKVVQAVTGVSTQSISYLKRKARDRGYDPTISRILKVEYVQDAPRSGRPTKVTPEVEQAILNNVRHDRNGREKSSAVLGYEHGVSATTILNVLRRNNFRPCKSTMKPGLDSAMKDARLQFCLRHQHLTLDDWKNVIWSDETSVVLNSRRGRRLQWRTPNGKYAQSCVRRRWKGCSEFMFWGYFSYEKKGPFHIWKPETAAEKHAAQRDIDKINEILEPVAKENWELGTGMQRMGLRTKGGRKPAWRWNETHGKVVRKCKGGIDWYRYQKVILLPKLLPFAKECMKDRPGTIVQEDKAPCHTSKHQNIVFMDAGVLRLLWPGNSPDLNMIEQCWYWMKKTNHT